MLARGCFDVSVKMIKQFRSFCGYKCKQTERPLLQCVIREQPISNLVLMSIQDAGAKAFGAAGLCAQAIPLKMYFLGGRVERAEQRLVQLRERFA